MAGARNWSSLWGRNSMGCRKDNTQCGTGGATQLGGVTNLMRGSMERQDISHDIIRQRQHIRRAKTIKAEITHYVRK